MKQNGRALESMIKRLILFTAVLILLIFNANLIYDFLMRLIAICYPFIFGAGLAFIFNIVSNGLMKYAGLWFHIKDTTGPRAIANILAIIFVFSIIFGFVFLLSPQLLDSIQSIVEQMPNALNHFYAWLLDVTRPIESIRCWICVLL